MRPQALTAAAAAAAAATPSTSTTTACPRLRRVQPPQGWRRHIVSLGLLGVLLGAAAPCQAFLVVAHSEPASSGPGNAYMLSWDAPNSGKGHKLGPWGDTIGNDRGFICNPGGNRDLRVVWPDEPGVISLSRVTMGFTHDGRYRCEYPVIWSMSDAGLNADDELDVDCAADGSCRVDIRRAAH